jgi:hypothetical protein
VPISGSSSSPRYRVRTGDVGSAVFCEAKATNAGGYGYGDSHDVTAAALTAPRDTKPPTLRVAARHCTPTRCVVNVLVADPRPSSGIRTVRARLSHRVPVACPRSGRRARCARTRSRGLAARPIGGGHFLAIARGLHGPRTYTLTLRGVDKAGNRQRHPTVVTLRVPGERTRR